MESSEQEIKILRYSETKTLIRVFRSEALEMCICVNCDYVDRCLTYHAVETNHQQQHLTETPSFEPNNPTINANISLPKVEVQGDQIIQETEFGFEYDVVGCDSFTESMGKWARLRPGQAVPT